MHRLRHRYIFGLWWSQSGNHQNLGCLHQQKSLFTGPGNYNGPNVLIRGDFKQYIGEFSPHCKADCITLTGTIESDGRNWVR